MPNPKICPNCGRVMERNDEGTAWVCTCGFEQSIYHGRDEEWM